MAHYVLMRMLLLWFFSLYVVFARPQERPECSRKYLPQVGDFDLKKFGGIWHAVASTDRDDIFHLNGTILHIRPHDELHAGLNIAGIDAEVCTASRHIHINVVEKSKLNLLNLEETYWVTSTDYKQFAVLFQAPHAVHILSRRRQLQHGANLRHKIHRHLEHQLCVPPRRLQYRNSKDEHDTDIHINGDLREAVANEIVEEINTDSKRELKHAAIEKFKLEEAQKFANEITENIAPVLVHNVDNGSITSIQEIEGSGATESIVDFVNKNIDSLDRDGKCLPPTDGYVTLTDTPGDMYSHYVSFHDRLKIIAITESHMLTMMCNKVNADGKCIKDKLQIDILGKTRDIASDLPVKFHEELESLCIGEENMELLSQAEKCDVPDDLQTSRCQLNDFPIQNNFDDEKTVGDWYLVAYLTDAIRVSDVSSSVSNGTHLIYTLIREQNGKCLAPRTLDYPIDISIDIADSSFDLGKNKKFRMRTVYYANGLEITYMCINPFEDGYCPREGIIFTVFSKRPVNLDDKEKEIVLDFAKKLCISKEKIFFKSYKDKEVCSLGSRCPDIAVDKMPVAKYSDPHHLSDKGPLYVTGYAVKRHTTPLGVAVDTFSNGEKLFVRYKAWNYKSQQCSDVYFEEHLKDSMLSTSMYTVKNNTHYRYLYMDDELAISYKCNLTESKDDTLICYDNPQWIGLFTLSPGTPSKRAKALFEKYTEASCMNVNDIVYSNITQEYMQILYIDSDVNIILSCITDKSEKRRTCKKGTMLIELFSTTLAPPSEKAKELFKKFVDAACVDVETIVFIEKPSESCVLKEEIKCHIDNFPKAIASSDLQKYEGQWFSVAKMKEEMEDSRTFKLNFNDNTKSISFISTGSLENNTVVNDPNAFLSRYGLNDTGLNDTDDLTFEVRECPEVILIHFFLAISPQLEIKAGGMSTVVPESILQEAQEVFKTLCINSTMDLEDTIHDTHCAFPKMNGSRCDFNNLPSENTNQPFLENRKWYVIAQSKGTVELENARSWVQTSSSGIVEFIIAGAMNGICIPPLKGYYITEGDELYAQLGEYRVEVGKIVYNDPYDRFMVILKCPVKTPDDKCDKIEVQIVSPTKKLPKDADFTIQDILNGLCLSVDELQYIDHQVDCPFPVEFPSMLRPTCSIKEMTLAKSMEIHKIYGKWYNVLRLKGNHSWTDGSQILREGTVENTVLLTYFSADSASGKCLPVVKGVMGYLKDTPAALYKMDGVSATSDFVRHAYVDDELLVVYGCEDTVVNNTCPNDRLFVEIYQKESNLKEENKAKVQEIISTLCYKFEDFEFIETKVSCDHLNDTYSWSAPPTFASDVYKQLLNGRWYSIERFNHEVTTMASVVTDMNLHEDGLIDMAISGQRNGECRPTSHFKIQLEKNGEMKPMDLDTKKPLKTSCKTIGVTSDMRSRVLLCCKFTKSEGECKHIAMAEILSRNVTIDIADKNNLYDVLHIAGIDVTKMQTYDNDMLCEPSTEKHVVHNKSCKVNDIRHQQAFDASKNAGVWYAIERIEGSGDQTNFFTLVIGEERHGHITAEAIPLINGECGRVVIFTMEKVDDTYADTIVTLGKFKVRTKVIYNDYKTIAVLYRCSHILEDGTCDPNALDIDIISRDPSRKLYGFIRAELHDMLNSICIDSAKLVKKMDKESCSPATLNKCYVKDMPVEQNLDLQKLSGMWYRRASLDLKKGSIGNPPALQFSVGSNGELKGKYRLSFKGRCLPPRRFTTTPVEKGSGTFVLRSTDNWHLFKIIGTLKVIETDYSNQLILYRCTKIMSDGTCNKDAQRFNVFSRSLSKMGLSQELNNTLRELTKKLCFDISEISPVKNDDVYCEIPIENEACKLKNFPLLSKKEIDTEAHLLFGHWYIVETLSRGSSWDNLQQYIALDWGDIVTYTSGSRNGRCLPTFTIRYTVDENNPGILKSKSSSARVKCNLTYMDGKAVEDIPGVVASIETQPLFDIEKCWVGIGLLKPLLNYLLRCPFWCFVTSKTWTTTLSCSQIGETYTYEGDSTFQHSIGGTQKVLKVIETDYNTASIYACSSLLLDGECEKGSSAMLFATRNSTSGFPNNASVYGDLVHDILVNFIGRSHIIRNEITDDCGPTQETDVGHTCKYKDSPAQAIVHMEKFAGIWYGVAVSKKEEFMVTEVQVISDDVISMVFYANLKGECIAPMTVLFKRRNDSFIGVISVGFEVTLKIVYADEDFAVIYSCLSKGKDIPCSDSESGSSPIIYVNSRSKDTELEEVVKRLQENNLNTTCITMQNLKTTPKADNCLQDAEPCKVNFNAATRISKFMGRQYPIQALSGVHYINHGIVEEDPFKMKVTIDENKAFIDLAKHSSECTQSPRIRGYYIPKRNSIFYPDYDILTTYIPYEDWLTTDSSPPGLIHVSCWGVEDPDSDYECKDVFVTWSSRQPIMMEETEVLLDKISSVFCYDTSKINKKDLESVEKCEFADFNAEDIKTCEVSKIQTQNHLDMQKMLGKWYGVATLRYTATSFGHSALLNIYMDGDILKIKYTSSIKGQCLPPVVATLRPDGTNVGSYTTEALGQSSVLKVTYLDDDYAVIYQCDKMNIYGNCHHSSTYVNILSREDNIDDATFKTLADKLIPLCIPPGDLLQTEHDVVCSLEEECKAVINNMRTPLNFSPEQIYTGTYYSTHTKRGMTSWQSISTHFILLGPGRVKMWTTGASGGQCLRIVDFGTITYNDTEPYKSMATAINSIFHIPYLSKDKQAFILFGCAGNTNYGKACPDEYLFVEYYSRSRHLPAAIKQELDGQLELLCTKPNEMDEISHSLNCPFNIGTRSLSECRVTKMTTFQDLDYVKFSGTWYGIATLRNDVGTFGDSAIVHITSDIIKDHIDISYTSSLHGNCLPSTKLRLEPDLEDASAFNVVDFGIKSHIRVVWTDYQLSVLYQCDHIEEDGLCEPESTHVTILSRNPGSRLNEVLIKELKVTLDSLCVDTNDVVAAKHDAYLKYMALTDTGASMIYICRGPLDGDGNCMLENVYVEYYSLDTVLSPQDEAVFSKLLERTCTDPTQMKPVNHKVKCFTREKLDKICKVDDIKTQQDFDNYKAAGLWYGVGGLPSSLESFGSSAVVYVQPIDQDSFTATYTSSDGVTCFEPVNVRFNRSSADGGTYIGTYQNITSHLKIIRSIYDWATIVYQCDKILPDGQCDPSMLYFNVITRKYPAIYSDQDIKHLNHILSSVCLSFQDIISFQNTAKCSLDTGLVHTCAINQFTTHRDFDKQRFEGIWYGVATLDSSFSSFGDAAVVNITSAPTGLKLKYTSLYEGRCLPPITVSIQQSEKDPATFGAEAYGIQSIMKVIYTDYTVALIYQCDAIKDDGLCENDKVHLNVIHRDPNVKFSRSLIERFKVLIDWMCVDVSQMTNSKHDVSCSIKYDPSAACQWDDIPGVHRGFNMVRGLQTKTHFRNTDPSFAKVHYMYNKTESVEVIFRIAVDGICQDQKSLKISGYQSIDGTEIVTEGANAVMKVIAATKNNEFAILSCVKYDDVVNTGVCPAQYVVMEYISDKMEIDSKVKEEFDEIVANACVDPSTIKPVPLVDCPLDIEKGAITELENKKCLFSDIHSMEGFQLDKFSGTWYGLATSKRSSNSFGDASVLKIYRGEMGEMEIRYTSLVNGICLPHVLVSLHQYGTKTGSFIARAHGVTSFIKVLTTDYNSLALIYQCDVIAEDGQCDPTGRHVDILTRNRSLELNLMSVFNYKVSLASVCVKEEDLVSRDHSIGCSLDVKPLDECTPQSVPLATNLDAATIFQGKWFITHILKGSRSWDSLALLFSNYHIDPEENEIHFKACATGARNGVCQPKLCKHIDVDRNNTAVFPVRSGNSITKFMIVSVSPDGRSMLAYTCLTETEQDKPCPYNLRLVEYRSRESILPAEHKTQFDSLLPQQLCTDPANLEQVDHDTAECDYDRVYTCKVEDIESHKDLEVTKLQGIWYGASSLKGSEASFGSSSVLRINSSSDGSLEVTYASSLESKCLIPVTLSLVPVHSKPSTFTATAYGLHSVIKVMYTDYDNVLTIYQCDKITQDGTCDPTKHHLNMLSRTRNSKFDLLKTLEFVGAAKTMCINIKDVVPTEHAVECPLEKTCTMNSVPAAVFEASEMYSGVKYTTHIMYGESSWESIMSYYEVSSDPLSNEVSIWVTGAQNGRCLPTLYGILAPFITWPNYYISLSIKTISKVVYLSEDRATGIVYGCSGNMARDKPCPNGLAYVEYFSNTRSISEQDKAVMDAFVLDNLCEDPRFIVPVNHEVHCEIDREVSQPEYSCNLNDITSQKDIDMEKMSGLWYGLAYHKTNSASFGEASVAQLVPQNGGKVKITYTSARNGECLTPITAELIPIKENSGRYLGKAMGVLSHVIILYTNYEIVMMYQCDKVNKDGTCVKNATYVDVLARDPKTKLNQIMLAEMIFSLDSLCIDIRDVQSTKHPFSCPLESSCTIQNSPTPDIYSGRWYTTHAIKSHNILDSTSNLIGLTRYNTSVLDIYGEKKSTMAFTNWGTFSDHGKCIGSPYIQGQFLNNDPLLAVYKVPETERMLEEYMGMDKDDSDVISIFKPVYIHASNKYMIWYGCSKTVSVDEPCPTEFQYVEYASREPSIPPEVKSEMDTFAEKNLCILAEWMGEVNHEVECPLEKTCTSNSFPKPEHFDTYDGLYYATHILKGGTTLQAVTSLANVSGNDSVYWFSGILSNGDCMNQLRFEGKNVMINSYTAELANINSYYQIVYVTPDKLSRIEIGCFASIDRDSPCPHEASTIQYQTKQPPLTDEDKQSFDAFVESTGCLSASDMIPLEIDIEDRCIPDPSKPYNQPVVGVCRVNDMKTQIGFDKLKLEGVWYGVGTLPTSEKSFGSSATAMVHTASDAMYIDYTSAIKNRCQAPVRVSLTGTNDPGTFIAEALGVKSVLKVIYLANDATLVYQCDMVLESGECSKDAVHLDVLTRKQNPKLNTVVIAELQMLYFEKLCINASEIQITKQEVTCSLVSQCSVNKSPSPKVFNYKEIYSGQWYITHSIRNSGTMDSWTHTFSISNMTIDGKPNFAFINRITNARNGSCESEMILHGRFINNNPLYAATGFSEHTPHITKPVYITSDEKHVIWYGCTGQIDDPCPAESIIYTSREPSLPYVVESEFDLFIEEHLCADPDWMETVNHDVKCPDKEMCSSNNLPQPAPFTAENLKGVWYVAYTVKFESTLHTITVDYDVTIDNVTGSATFDCVMGGITGVGECLQQRGVSLPMARSNLMTINGYYQILDISPDNSSILFFGCNNYIDLGTPCAPESFYLEYLTKTPPLSDDVKKQFDLTVERSGCASAADVRPMHIDYDGQCLPDRSKPINQPYTETCQVKDIKTQVDLDKKLFKGRWYGRVHISDTSESSFGSSSTAYVDVLEDGNITITYTSVIDGECQEPVKAMLTPTEDPGTFLGYALGVTSIIKIIFTNYEIALVYQCDSVLETGECSEKHLHLDVLSRTTSDKINTILIAELNIYLQKYCIDSTRLKKTDQEGRCNVYSSLNRTCNVDEVAVQQQFNASKFYGKWYDIARTRYTEGNTYEQGIGVFQPGGSDDEMYMYYVGLDKAGVCIDPVKGLLKFRDPSKQNGDFMIYIDIAVDQWKTEINYNYKVVYTDYHNAVIYSCYNQASDGTCKREFLQVDVLSRSPSIPYHKQLDLAKIIDGLCIDVEDIIFTKHGDTCQLPQGFNGY
ncbi:unnamed protein product [Owenia fusiformis]|uniref:Uncharacterized protein n=1 Tax=Owenia fusiformis TaxID=6347 RepID=A0A8S4NYG9_OWEFU|nr:unnamed protein product [Owenia fusiformis]